MTATDFEVDLLLSQEENRTGRETEKDKQEQRFLQGEVLRAGQVPPQRAPLFGPV